jgi:hypothetical protein
VKSHETFFLDPAKGPASSSVYNFIKLAFKSGGMRPFLVKLQETLSQKRWLVMVAPKPLAQKKIRSGIGGIEKSMAMKSKQTDKEISKVVFTGFNRAFRTSESADFSEVRGLGL